MTEQIETAITAILEKFFSACQKMAEKYGEPDTYKYYFHNSKGESPDLESVKKWKSPKQIAWLKRATEVMEKEISKSKGQKVYLSGPMRGYPDNNFQAFHTIAAALRAKGLDVVSPAELNPLAGPVTEDSPGWREFYNIWLRADLRAMMDCDAIALMRGWERSNGANLELHVAHRVGMEVLFVDDLLVG